MNIFEAAGAGKFIAPLINACRRWGIVDEHDQARFLAQLSVESAGFTKTVESLHYRPETLLRVANGRNGLTGLEQATEICNGGEESVGNFLYGGMWGAKHLGNLNDGDGFKFRGRGLIQITGYNNYRAASMGCYGDQRLITAPDLLALDMGAADAAAWFWYSRHLSGLTDVAEITKRINGGSEGLDRRQAMTSKLLGLL